MNDGRPGVGERGGESGEADVREQKRHTGTPAGREAVEEAEFEVIETHLKEKEKE